MYAGLPYEDYDIITKNGDIERSNNEDKRRDIIGSIHFFILACTDAGDDTTIDEQIGACDIPVHLL